MPVVLEARNLVKHYGHVTALDGTDFELHRGEILAVIGDNGAGKSTLINALSGALIPDSGEVRLDGQVVLFRNPIDARRAGIETVYQDLAVAPAMSIAENLFLGREPRRSSHQRQLPKRLRARREQRHPDEHRLQPALFGDDVPTRLTTADISRQFRVAPIPEPATWALLIAGMGLTGAMVRRRRSALA